VDHLHWRCLRQLPTVAELALAPWAQQRQTNSIQFVAALPKDPRQKSAMVWSLVKMSATVKAPGNNLDS